MSLQSAAQQPQTIDNVEQLWHDIAPLLPSWYKWSLDGVPVAPFYYDSISYFFFYKKPDIANIACNMTRKEQISPYILLLVLLSDRYHEITSTSNATIHWAWYTADLTKYLKGEIQQANHESWLCWASSFFWTCSFSGVPLN